MCIRDSRWADSGHPIRVYGYAEEASSVEAMVAAGFGISLCLESACRPQAGLCYRDIREPLREQVALFWSRGEREKKLAEELLTFLLPAAGEPGQPGQKQN